MFNSSINFITYLNSEFISILCEAISFLKFRIRRLFRLDCSSRLNEIKVSFSGDLPRICDKTSVFRNINKIKGTNIVYISKDALKDC